MNIFFLDTEPTKAAVFQCDKHVVKMTLESTQLLSGVFRMNPDWPIVMDTAYKLTHKNHPCAIWARQSLENFMWLYEHALALSNEYTFRYKKIHKCHAIINSIPIDNMTKSMFPQVGYTPTALAMPDEYKTIDAVESYRAYYKLDKMRNIQCVWTRRERPDWINE